MLSKTIQTALNEQIKLEFETSNIYLQMSSWALNQGYDGTSKFMSKHAEEEMGHMKKLFDYVNKTGSMAIVPRLDQPPIDYKNMEDLFKETYKREMNVTKCINDLVSLSFEEKDFSTFNFLQWYVSEQHEEEALFKGILDKIGMIGNDKLGLYTLDKAMENML